jgi:magnesium-transporting ATPase (P-type)
MITGNPTVWISIAVLMVLQVAFLYLPFMNSWFGSAPLGLDGWLIPLGLAVGIFALVEVGKGVARRKPDAVEVREFPHHE